jgi:hypothetical protein
MSLRSPPTVHSGRFACHALRGRQSGASDRDENAERGQLRERERSTSDRPNDALNSVMSFPANGARALVSPNFIDEVGRRSLLRLTSHAPSLLLWMDWASRPQLRFRWVTNVLTNCIPG